MPGVFKRAHGHKGASFVEIFQNCIVYADGIFEDFTDKKVAAETQLHAEHGQPLIYGKDKDKGLRLNARSHWQLDVVTIGEDGVTEADILIHDETNPVLANMLVHLSRPDFPMVLGVIYSEDVTSFEADVHAQMDQAVSTGKSDLGAYMARGRTWRVD